MREYIVARWSRPVKVDVAIVASPIPDVLGSLTSSEQAVTRFAPYARDVA